MSSQKVIKLKPPKISLESKVGYKAGLRPLRKGGVRLEQEMQGDKVIVHNYGHGGGGVSVGYGYSQLAVDLFERENMIYPTNRDVAVIGSGYIGLYTSIILATRGYSVTLYADQFVSPSSLVSLDQQSHYPLTSQVAGGVWLPAFYEYNTTAQTRQIHDQSTRISFNFYKECLEKKKYSGISYKTFYSVPSIDAEKDSIPKDIDMNYDNSLVTFDDGKHILQTSSFRTFFIEGDLFLPNIVSECDKLKVNFVKKHFDSREELNALKEQYIFNCTGLASGLLFNDKKVQSVKGQLVVLEPDTEIDYFFVTDLTNADRLVIFPSQQGITLGHYSKTDDYNKKPTKEVVDRIFHNALTYFQQFNFINPSL